MFFGVKMNNKGKVWQKCKNKSDIERCRFFNAI